MEFELKGEILDVEAGEGIEILDSNRLRIDLGQGRSCIAHAVKVGDDWWIHMQGRTIKARVIEAGANIDLAGSACNAPMPGTIIEVLVTAGQQVGEGEALITMEAMKMEHRILAPSDGVVDAVHFQAGDKVESGELLLDFSASE